MISPDYDLTSLKTITPWNRNFQMLVTGRFATQLVDNAYEGFSSDLLLAHMKADGLFIDVGAHYGYYTLLAAVRYPDCKILAFEPVNENYDILNKNIQLNNLHNVTAYKLAASDEKGTRNFNITGASDNCGFYGHPMSENISKTIVETVRLDDILRDVRRKNVTIKIDTEGHEIAVINGMRNFLTGNDNVELLVEFNPKCLQHAGHQPADLLELLSQLDFDLYFISDTDRVFYKLDSDKLDAWPACMKDANRDYVNILCIKKAKSLNVCFFSHSPNLDGAERSLLELTHELIVDYGSMVSVIVPGEGLLKTKLEDAGAAVINLNYGWWCTSMTQEPAEINRILIDSYLNLVPDGLDLLRKINPDVISTNSMVIPWGAMAAGLLNKPHVWFVREFGQLDHKIKFILPLGEVTKTIVDSSNLVFTNSTAVKNTLFDKFPADRIFSVYTHFDIAAVSLQGGPRYYTDSGSLKLIIAGTVSEQKGQIDAILAVKELICRGEKAELTVLGKANQDYRQTLQSIIDDAKLNQNIRLVDFVENPYQAINQADVILVCSKFEAFGRVTAEAMVLKKPVIGANSGGTAELIQEGYNGLLYEPGNYLQLADRIEYFIRNREKIAEFGANGYSFATTNFSREKFGGLLYQAFNGLKNKVNPLSGTFSRFINSVILNSVAELKNHLSVRSSEMENELTIKDTLVSHIQQLEREITLKNMYLDRIESGLVMRLMTGFKLNIEKIIKPGTGLHTWYESSLDGLRSFFSGGERAAGVTRGKGRPAGKYMSSCAQPSRKATHFSPVDVIVPVFNGLANLQACISAVLSYTGDIPYRLVIIDDGSSEKGMAEYLDHLKFDHGHMVIIRNTQNLGFLQSINKGVSLSRNDVVALNSDTVVTHEWLTALQSCAYGDAKIATVTPLSNNATICSVPEFCKNNAIPDGYDIQEFASLVKKSASATGIGYHEIPVGVGFCMYIKRAILDDIGLYDTEFGRGYEEEVNFCLEARKKGYYNVVCPHAFVYHIGQASFQESQNELEQKNWQLLVERHPYYPELISDFTSDNPLGPLQAAIRDSIDCNKKDEKAVSIGIDSQLLNSEQWTGSARYTYKLVDKLAGLRPGASEYITVFSTNADLDKFYDNGKFKRKFAHNSADILWDPDFYKCDVFHRPFQCYSIYDLLLLLNSRRSVVSILDLISFRHPEYFENIQKFLNYQNITRLSAKYADRVLALSEFCRKDISENLNIPLEKIEVLYPPLSVDKNLKGTVSADVITDFKKRQGITRPYILYVSTLFPHKNHENLIKAFKNLIKEYDRPLDLFMVGPDTHLNNYREKLDGLISDISDRVKIINYVSDEDIALFYKCAETFAYPSLDEGFGIPPLEAMYYNVPVVCSKSASLPEIVGDSALVVDCTHVDEFGRALYQMLTDTNLRKALVHKGSTRAKYFLDKVDATDLAKIYASVPEHPEKSDKNLASANYEEELEDVAANPQERYFLRNKWPANRKY